MTNKYKKIDNNEDDVKKYVEHGVLNYSLHKKPKFKKKHKTEFRLFRILKELYDEVYYDVEFDWCIFPKTGCYGRFDFYLPKYKILIELDGDYHFYNKRKLSKFRKIRYRDIYKMKHALLNGFTFIRIYQPDLAYHLYINDTLWLNQIKNMIKTYNIPEIVLLNLIKDPLIIYDSMLNELLDDFK